MKSSALALAGNPELQDRVELFSNGRRILIALADGAGGLSGGAQAADTLIKLVSGRVTSVQTAADCQHLLAQADQSIANDRVAGETTGIILAVDSGQIFGASVGDSEAWIFSGPQAINLTKLQCRKPLLGSGVVRPVPFTYGSSDGLLIVATDGLWKYTSHERIQAELDSTDIEKLPHRLVDLVRLRSGALQDDIAIAVISIE